MASSRNTAALCEKYPFIYGAVGVHPSDSLEINDETLKEDGILKLLEGIENNGEITAECENAVLNELRGNFRPEFLNRLDEMICFKALDKTVVNGIVDNLLKGLFKRVKDQGVELTVSPEAKTFLIEEGYDINFGARPLKRIIQSEIETFKSREEESESLKIANYLYVQEVKELRELLEKNMNPSTLEYEKEIEELGMSLRGSAIDVLQELLEEE